MDSEEQSFFEELHQRHRKEKKELQGKIQSLKKSASKGDKKKKKEVTEEILQLENEIRSRHEREVNDLTPNCDLNNVPQPDEAVNDLQQSVENVLEINGFSSEQRITKAQRRRERKVAQLKDRELRILEQDVENLKGAKHIETEQIKMILKARGLMIREVPSDGDCLYNAVLVRLKELNSGQRSITLAELRSNTSDFLQINRDEYLPYLSHPDTGNMFTESQYDEYCNQVANTSAWGGEVELRALAHILKRPIEVIQAKGPVIVAGEEYSEAKDNHHSSIVLTYHRHMYGLGEHYNSVTEYVEVENDQFDA